VQIGDTHPYSSFCMEWLDETHQYWEQFELRDHWDMHLFFVLPLLSSFQTILDQCRPLGHQYLSGKMRACYIQPMLSACLCTFRIDNFTLIIHTSRLAQSQGLLMLLLNLIFSFFMSMYQQDHSWQKFRLVCPYIVDYCLMHSLR